MSCGGPEGTGCGCCDSSRLPSSSPAASVPPGAVADSISKWVFRHRLAPENLKAFLQKSDDPDDERHNEPGDQPEKQRNDQEGTQGTAGQDTLLSRRLLLGYLLLIFLVI